MQICLLVSCAQACSHRHCLTPSPPLHFPFQWKTYNPAFSRLEIWFRFVFVVLTFIVIVSSVCLRGSAAVTEGGAALCQLQTRSPAGAPSVG